MWERGGDVGPGTTGLQNRRRELGGPGLVRCARGEEARGSRVEAVHSLELPRGIRRSHSARLRDAQRLRPISDDVDVGFGATTVQ